MQNNDLDQFFFLLNNNNEYSHLPASSNHNQDSAFHYNYNYSSFNSNPEDINYQLNDSRYHLQNPIDSFLDHKDDHVVNNEGNDLFICSILTIVYHQPN